MSENVKIPESENRRSGDYTYNLLATLQEYEVKELTFVELARFLPEAPSEDVLGQ
jgi:hypothetical protein